jgi:hypothetical protein
MQLGQLMVCILMAKPWGNFASHFVKMTIPKGSK